MIDFDHFSLAKCLQISKVWKNMPKVELRSIGQHLTPTTSEISWICFWKMKVWMETRLLMVQHINTYYTNNTSLLTLLNLRNSYRYDIYTICSICLISVKYSLVLERVNLCYCFQRQICSDWLSISLMPVLTLLLRL